MFNWSTGKIHLFLRSMQINASMKVKIKGVFTVKMLEQLVKKERTFQNGRIFAALFLSAFSVFFSFVSLDPK